MRCCGSVTRVSGQMGVSRRLFGTTCFALKANSNTNYKTKNGNHRSASKSSSKTWKLPSIDTLVEDGIIEIGPGGKSVFKHSGSFEKEEEDNEGKDDGHIHGKDITKKHSDTKTPNPASNFSTGFQERLARKKESYSDVLEKLDDETRTKIFSKLDRKALSVLQRRPELESRLLSTIERDKLLEEDIDIGTKSQRVPEGWRKDKNLPDWKRQIYALREKFGGERWDPKKKLSREAIEGIRMLKQHAPHLNAGDFASMFKISPESIRRILRSKWEPTDEEMNKIAEKWARRGVRVKTMLKEERREQRRLEMEAREKERALEAKNYKAPEERKQQDSKKKKKRKMVENKNKDDDDDDDYYDDPVSGISNQVF